jgi:hypothetical protein
VVVQLSFLGKFRAGAKPRFVLGKFQTDLDFRQIEADLGVAAPNSKYGLYITQNLSPPGPANPNEIYLAKKR